MINILLKRLIVLKNEKELYNEEFHEGINVIRGDNTVGKSTILDLIFYGFGGEIKKENWTYPANECDKVVLEVYFNHTLFTLQRKIDIDSIREISIKESAYTIDSEWMTFGPRRSDNKMSFSQFIFDLLGWENYKTDEYANLTMHQILRMLYIDQESDSLKIFRTESRGDSESLRQAIAEFLLGLDDLETYKTRQDLLKKEKLLEKTKSELNAIVELLGKDATYTVETFDNEIKSLFTTISEINEKKLRLLQQPIDGEESDNNEFVKNITLEIDNLASKISKNETLQSQITTELIDCEEFKENLKFRKKSLVESRESARAFGFVEFIYCPSCNTKVEKNDDINSCPLCKSEQHSKNIDESYLEVLTELEFQEKQNEYALNQFEIHLKELEFQLKNNYENLYIKKKELRTIIQYSTKREQELTEMSKEIGFTEAQIKTLEEKKEIIFKLNKLREDKVSIETDIYTLSLKLELLQEKNIQYKETVLNSISKIAKSIIENDLNYEELFKNASKYDDEIDFAKDRWLLDGRVKFSGSANYIKKNAFHLSCLYNSLKNKDFRYPRFLIIDDIENGGMKPERSQNFQKTILDLFKDKTNFQIIFATAMIDEKLEDSKYTVGRFYNREDYILKI